MFKFHHCVFHLVLNFVKLWICNLFMEHLGILKNSLKRVCAFQIELEFGRVGFYRGKPECSDKNLSEQGREPTTNSAHMWFK